MSKNKQLTLEQIKLKSDNAFFVFILVCLSMPLLFLIVFSAVEFFTGS